MSGRHYCMQQSHIKSRLSRLDAFDISQNIENIMDGKDYQRLSIEKDWNRQRNSATIQDEDITISIGHRMPLSVPDLGLWRPLDNNITENTSTPWPNKFNDCKDMCGIIMLQLTMSRNVAATQTVTTFCPLTLLPTDQTLFYLCVEQSQ